MLFGRLLQTNPSTPAFSLRSLARLAVVVGVLALAVVVPFAVSPKLQIMIVLMAIAVASTVLFLSSPPIGLIALIVAAMIVPSPELPGGLNVAVLLLGFLIALWIVDMVVRQRTIWLVESRTVRPLLVMVIGAILSFGVGQLPWFPYSRYAPLDTQLGGLMIFVFSLGAFLLTAQQITDLRWLERMTWVFLALSAVYFVGWIVPGLGTWTTQLFQRGAVANSMFWLWPTSLALSQALFNRTLNRLGRLALGALAMAILYVAFTLNYDWKSGYVPALVAIVVIFALWSWRIAFAIALSAPAALSILLTRAIETDEYSYYSRLDAWVIVLEIVKANPILGLGPANYYWYVQQIPLRGYFVRFNSHNQYVDLVAQLGVLGLACFAWFVVEVGMLALQLRKLVSAGFAQAYVVGVLGGLAGMVVSGMLADWFFPFAYNIGLDGFRGGMLAWLFLGGLVAIERIARRNEPEQTALESSISEAPHYA